MASRCPGMVPERMVNLLETTSMVFAEAEQSENQTEQTLTQVFKEDKGGHDQERVGGGGGLRRTIL